MKEKILKKSWLSIFVKLPTDVELSKKRQRKYFRKGDSIKIPKKYQGKHFRYLPFPCSRKVSQYTDQVIGSMYGKLYLTDTRSLQRCVSNPRSAGTPKTVRIGGNLLYAGGSGFIRKRVMECIKEEAEWQVISHSEGGYPSFVFAFWKVDRLPNQPEEGQGWDFDNQVRPYNKALLDECQKKGLIPDDHSGYIQSNVCSFLEDGATEEGLECVLCFIKKDEYELL